MPSATKKITLPYVITASDNGLILEPGPASTAASVGTFSLQFNPDQTSDYSAVVLGRTMGQSALAANIPYLPVPFRQVTRNNIAKDYAFDTTAVTGPSKIQVPSNGDAIGLLVSCSTGNCTITGWGLNGPSAV